MAVSTLKLSCDVRATRNVPSEVCSMAAEPTEASAGEPSIETDTVRPLTVPDTELNCGAPPPEGEVGLPPPPHAVSRPVASSEAPRQAEAQNSRRVCVGVGSR